MAQYTASFEGVNGALVQLSDSPGWDARNGNTLYGVSPAGVIDGTTCLHAQTFAADPILDNSKFCTLAKAVASNEYYGRLYLYINQPSDSRNGRFFSTGGSKSGETFGMRFRPGGFVDFVDDTITVIGSTTGPVPINKWLRVEWHVIHGNPGTAEVRFYIHDPNALNPTEVVNLTGNIPYGSFHRYGVYTNNSADNDYYIDAVVDDSTTWVGAAGPPTFGAKVWNGTAWVDNAGIPVWNGTVWTDSPEVVVWDGYQWVRVI